jgi:hypothetical protein
MWVKQFIESSRKATSVEELLLLLREALRDLGIGQTVVGLMTVTALTGFPDTSLLQKTRMIGAMPLHGWRTSCLIRRREMSPQVVTAYV